MKKILILATLAFMMLPVGAASKRESLEKRIAATHRIISTDEWYGGHRIKFDFEGFTAWVVEPAVKPAEGNPWTWTMQWATAFVPRTGVPDLLAKGWYHVTLEAFATKASDEALPMFDRYQRFLVDTLGLAPKACLIGMSWGGFYSTRYAAAYPANIKAIYLDAPLMNFDGRKRDRGPWNDIVPENGCWTEDPRMPVNKAKALADAGLPILLLYGEEDQVLNPVYNCELFAARFKAAGGNIEVIARPMWGHHPHGLDPGETIKIVEFFSK